MTPATSRAVYTGHLIAIHKEAWIPPTIATGILNRFRILP